MQDHNCFLRDANSTDEVLIEKWLRNLNDCKMTIGHAPLNEHDFGEWLHADDQSCFVLVSPVGPIGYGEIWIDHDAEDLELAHLVVSPDYRNKGFGKLLAQLLFEKGRQYGFPTAYMRIYPKNIPALKSYVSAGFTPVNDHTSDMPSDWVWLSKLYRNTM